jgi:hypothetical protein
MKLLTLLFAFELLFAVSASACNIDFTIELQTFGENVQVELRNGSPGKSRPIKSQRSQGGQVGFYDLCPGSYFLAIGNNDYVSVTPVRNFTENSSYKSNITMQRGSGNVSKKSRKNL